MFRENMHPPQTNVRSKNIEIEYSCQLSHANGSFINKEKSVNSKKTIVQVSNEKRHDCQPGALPIALHWISFAQNTFYVLPRNRVIISSEKRRTVTTVGFEPATLKSDPCPGERDTSSSAW